MKPARIIISNLSAAVHSRRRALLLALTLLTACSRETDQMEPQEKKWATWLDRPEVLAIAFHPREELAMPAMDKRYIDITIPVDPNMHIGGRFYASAQDRPTILFFHGNGEIVADYDDLGRHYAGEMGFNFFAVDYRGYGRSSGTPTVSAMLNDAVLIFVFVRDWLARHAYSGPLVVMGRSLGSASALEIAAKQGQHVQGVIIESGFAHIIPLLERLGARLPGAVESKGGPLDQTAKLSRYLGPVLIIHGEHDQIIPFSDAGDLLAAVPHENKRLVRIAGGRHNSLLQAGWNSYMQALRDFMTSLEKSQ